MQQAGLDPQQLRSLLQLSLESLESNESSSEEVATADAPLLPVEPAPMAESTPNTTHPVVTNTTTGPAEATLEPQTYEPGLEFLGTGATPPQPAGTFSPESPTMETTNVAPPEPYPLEKNSSLPGPARGDNM